MPVRSRPAHRLAALAALTVSVLGLLASPASAATRQPYDLTPRQEAVVLDLIDDLCGDTWCEGDHAFDFRRFSCDPDARACTLRLRIASYDEEPLQWRWRSGTLTGFARFRQMVVTSDTGYRSLDEDFRAAVDALVHEVEESVG